ncbi:MAG TPA: methyltransferase domain-containing protein [Gammaproteobacteria bacterium]|nr:methyltransferase domain-containing protein [Gammaproteobacteria bacterium]
MPAMEALPHRTLHRAQDDKGIVEVIEDGVTRTLYFGSRAKQSCMLLDNPQVLVLSYTQAMTAALLFQPVPSKVLLLGLGGGSLACFLYHHFPDCQILAVEQRAAVVETAREFFAVPTDERLRIHTDSALDYLARPDGETFDLILVDLFSATGMDGELEEAAFFARCRERLAPGGVVSVNLWASRPNVCRQHIKRLNQACDGQVLELPLGDCGNLIALGLTQAFPVKRLTTLKTAAEALFQRFGIDYPGYLDRLRRRNRFRLRFLFGH